MAATQNTGPNLTNVTFIGRQVVKFGAIALVVIMVGRTTLNAFVAFWKATHPEPPPPPTVGFGILPKLRFPERADVTKPEKYVLETATGTVPQFGDRAKVFFMPPSALGLLADEKARQLAAQYDYLFEPEIHNIRVYRWTKSQPLNSTLQVDIRSLSFTLTTDYLTHPELLADPNLPDSYQAVSDVKRFFERSGIVGEDLATASGEIVYMKSVGGELAEAVSYSDADFIQIDINRTPIDDQYRMYTTEGYKGVINAVVTGALGSSSYDSIVHFENNYHVVDYSEYHTYPLRTTQEAWQILKAGEGYVAQEVDMTKVEDSTQAVIRNVYLGYYDDFEEQEYLQPIYVFEGDGGFLGYVSAVEAGYLQSGGVGDGL